MKLLLPFAALTAAFTPQEHEIHYCLPMPPTDARGKVTGETPDELKVLGMKYLTHFADALGVNAADYHYVVSYIDDDVSSKGHDWKVEVRFETMAGCVPVTTACSIELDIGCKDETHSLSDWPLLEVEHRVTRAEIPQIAEDAVNAALAEMGMTIDDCGGYEYSHNIHNMEVFKVQWENEGCHLNNGKIPIDVEISQLTGATEWITTHEPNDKSQPYWS